MLSYLSGQPILEDHDLTILVNGVGYEVKVGEKIKQELSQLTTQSSQLYIHTHVREDRIELYGFDTIEAKKLFRLFLNISGVGPQTALSIVDHQPSAIIDAVQNANTHFFSSIPRIGKKMAQKIIIELRSKLGEIKSLDLTPETQMQTEIREALTTLGFDDASISKALEEIDNNSLSLEENIRQCIRIIGSY